MAKSELKSLKNEFYEWCGLLSIEEILSNSNLIKTIERLQRLLVEV